MDYSGLNEPQKEGVMTTEGPVLILAGAGSGKTRVLMHRAAHLIEEGVRPYHILAITFTNKAAKEMQERIDNMMGAEALGMWISTFHSLCVRILRQTIDVIGYTTNFSIYDADDQKALIKDVCKQLNIDTKQYKEKMFMGAISRAKDSLISVEEFESVGGYDMSHKLQARVYRKYQEQLKKNNALDFDDLIFRTVDVFRKDEEILKHYQDRFQYIMVDEYQDTNHAQFELVRLLAGSRQNLCVVGDDDQSIYKFRGANIYNILNFEEHFPKAKVIKLEENYRSTQNILDAANAVIHNNKERKDKTLWTGNGRGEPVKFKVFDTAYEEAEAIVYDIKRKRRETDVDYKDCAILYRTNAQSRILEEKFIGANVPYKIVGGINFYSRKEIKDVLAYLKTIDNAQDDLAVRRILNVPKRGIGATSVAKIQTYADLEAITFYEALSEADEIAGVGPTAKKITPFVNLIRVARAKVGQMPVARLIEELMEDTGYIAELRAERTEEAEDRIANIEELISKAADYDSVADDYSLSGFLEEVALVADIDSLDEDSNYVTMMTLHSAKGLEFDNVYMSGMEDGLFPSFMSITSPDAKEELEEERRLCYVGITRAKKDLTMTAANCRMVNGETRYSRVSRFVQEIPEELITLEGRGNYNRQEERYTVESSRKESKDNTPGGYSRASRAETMRAPSGAEVALKKAKDLAAAGAPDYAVGDTVKHIKFGEGKVLEMVDGGKDYEVTVDFGGYGVKKMFASFAKLKKM